VNGVTGHAVLATGFPAALGDALVADARRHAFRLWSPRKGGALAMAAPDDPAPRSAIGWLSQAADDAGFGPFVPNEVSYQRYTATGNGLPPHRDQRYYATCIAIVTLRGSATFGVHGSRERDDVIAEWTTGPGQVVLLRGWSPGDDDPRPYHRIDPPPAGERLMFQARHNLVAEPGSPWAEHLTEVEIEQAARLARRVPPAQHAG
jgi:hypothetical protein